MPAACAMARGIVTWFFSRTVTTVIDLLHGFLILKNISESKSRLPSVIGTVRARAASNQSPAAAVWSDERPPCIAHDQHLSSQRSHWHS